MNLVEELHVEDHLEVIHGHNGEIELSAPCSKSYVHALCGASNGLG